MRNQPHLTAITRKKLSLPMQYLVDNKLLNGRTLDYGCGKGFDCDFLGIEGYDPYYRPRRPPGWFDTIACNYVLNVLEPHEWQGIIDEILRLLLEGGKAYITVRSDARSLKGWTKRGTYQCDVRLNLPLEHQGKFRMYRLDWITSAQGVVNAV